MSSPYSAQYYSGAVPMPVPTKGSTYPNYYSTDSTYSVSPPEGEPSVSSGSGGAGSYGNTGYSNTASYAGSSHGDYDSAGSASGIDFNEYMHDRFAETFDPLPLDKTMAQQAQM